MTDECPHDVEGLEQLMRMGIKANHWDLFDDKWLCLVVVYNLHSVPAINTWLVKAREALLKNVQKCSSVKRSCDKKDSTLKGGYPSRMVGVGPYLNLPKGPPGVETSARYEILVEAEFVLDGMITVTVPRSSGVADMGLDSDVLMPTLANKWRTDGVEHKTVPSGINPAF